MNLVCGWYRAEMEMFGDPMYGHEDRYALAHEWVQVFDRLWDEPTSFDFDGRFYDLKGAIIQPRSPYRRPVFLNAGGSERGQEFAARDCDVAFIIPQDPRPEALKRQVDQYRDLARERYDKEIQVWMSCYVVQRDTLEEARAYVQDYVVTRGDRPGVDAFLANNVGNAHTFPEGVLDQVRFAIAAGYGGYPILGPAEQITETLASLSDAGVDGLLLTWLDYEGGLAMFGESVLPMMEREGLREPAHALT
jgi:alkanesulfonate monooxygenase SsuD/methylene tetrahydromethanopterin reductase-like flavin-dependent oxidoreductase (luciferase family)